MRTLFNRREYQQEKESIPKEFEIMDDGTDHSTEHEPGPTESNLERKSSFEDSLKHHELPAEAYTHAAKQVPEIHAWFDEVQAETVQRHLRSEINESDSLSIMIKLGELYKISGRREYQVMAQQRFETTMYRESDTLQLVPYWVETAVTLEDKQALDTLFLRVVERDLNITETRAAALELSPNPLRKKLVDYAYIVNGYARLGHFDGMGAHFNRLDRYWCGELSENYFDWMGDESQVTDTVGKPSLTHPARQKTEVDYGSQRVDILAEIKTLGGSFEGQNRLFFHLLNDSRTMWLNHLIEQYEIDSRLPDEPQPLQHDDSLQKEIYAQICRVSDFSAQRRLHQRHYWRQPPQGKKNYESTLSSGAIFSTDTSGKQWQPTLLSGRREELVRFGLSGKESVVMPSYTRRCVEQFEDDPSIGPMKQLTLFALHQAGKIERGGQEILEVCERNLPSIRAFESADQKEVVNMLDALAAAAAEQSSHSYEVRFMLEKAILTGSPEHYDEFLEKRSEYIFQLNQNSVVSDSIAARHIQWKLDWGTLAEATADYFIQNLLPERQISIGMQLLRASVNRGVSEREAGRIVQQIESARATLKSASVDIEGNKAIDPLVNLLALYQQAVSPSPTQSRPIS